jgi:hypothetical protein
VACTQVPVRINTSVPTRQTGGLQIPLEWLCGLQAAPGVVVENADCLTHLDYRIRVEEVFYDVLSHPVFIKIAIAGRRRELGYLLQCVQEDWNPPRHFLEM